MSEKLQDRSGNQPIVYIREANRDALPEHLKQAPGKMFAVHDPSGNMLALAGDRSLAFAMARRNDLTIDPKRLSELFEIRTSHMSNIISVKLGWGGAQEAIEMVNDLMRIACEKTTANRRETFVRISGKRLNPL